MPLRFLTLDPGHFHAALVQKEMYPQIDPRCHVYAPLGGDLLAHLQRLVGFNTRSQHPTRWKAEVHAGDDFLDRAFAEKPGNVVVLAGKNARKIDYIVAAVQAGLHVLADKPWILVPGDLPKLQAVLDLADDKGVIAYDIMTERYEITSILQKELLNDPAIFGEIIPGTLEEPGVYLESVHFLKKLVAGAPLRRPAWFFDVHQQGEGLSDVGTHLVDLIAWMLYPGQALNYLQDLTLAAARRWPTMISRTDFQQVTGVDFPDFLTSSLLGDQLAYHCNTQVQYALRGTQVKMDVLWGLEAAAGAGDTHLAIFRGTRANVEIRQGPEEKYRPELYVVPRVEAETRTALDHWLERFQKTYPGLGREDQPGRFKVVIPEKYRVGHEAHFGEVTQQFLRYVMKEEPLPSWEKPNMAAKYFVTTMGVELARKAKA